MHDIIIIASNNEAMNAYRMRLSKLTIKVLFE